MRCNDINNLQPDQKGYMNNIYFLTEFLHGLEEDKQWTKAKLPYHKA